MKVYIGRQEINDQSFKVIKQIELLDMICDDSECTELIIDNILRQYPLGNLDQLLQLIVRKIRLNGKIVITDVDFELLAFYYSTSADLLQLNNYIHPCSSLLTMDYIINLFTTYGLELRVKNYNSLNFILEFWRVK